MQCKPTVRVMPYMLKNAYAFQSEVRRVLTYAKLLDEKDEFLCKFPRIDGPEVISEMVTHALEFVELNFEE